MKNKKLVLVITGLLVLVLLFQLSFTFFAIRTENAVRKKYTKDGKVDNVLYARHLDSISDKSVYNLGIFEFTYNECKNRELGLGLDLRGGMNVVLEVSKEKVLEKIAGKANAKDTLFQAAAAGALEKIKTEGGDYVDLFVEEYKARGKGRTLSSAFMNNENKANINTKSNDQEVVDYIKGEINDGINRAYQVLETRLNQSSISQNTIQKLDGGRISVEIPGAENPKRIRDLLERQAALEFWDMYENNKANDYMATKMMFDLDSFLSTLPQYKLKNAGDSSKSGDSAQKTNVLEGIAGAGKTIGKEAAPVVENDSTKKAQDSAKKVADAAKRSYPLFEVMSPAIGNNEYYAGPAVGYVAKFNLNKLKELLNSEDVKRYLPGDLRFAFDAKPNKQGGFYTVYALQADRRTGEARMTGDMINNATVDNDPSQGIVVSMSMNADASEKWKNMTRDNASGEDNKSYVAVVLDGSVYSAPGVSEEISGGNTQISGAFDLDEAQDLANVLKAGKLPVPVQIIGEDVVGPSLGKESIKSGRNALIMGFIAIILFMIAYYGRAGFIANLAVIVNIFFILGALASRGAALTLPGIAGLLLTIGMAVDANVLIYERIKEELASGKTLKTSIQLGYKAAFSAILDANVTSLISGFILLTAGTGPVYGFAIILIIGIFSSLFTALLISRLIIEYRVEKGKEINFETGLSAKVLKNPNFNFIQNRKKFYFGSLAVILVGAVGFFTIGIPLGLDFKGGYSYTIQLPADQNVSVSDIKEKIVKLDQSGSDVKKFGTNNRFKVMTTYMIDNNDKETPEKVKAAVIDALKDYKVTEASIKESAKVGPTMAKSTKNKSILVTLLSIFAIFLYIVFRFRNLAFGLGATIALIHDVLIVFGLYALLNPITPFNLELDQTFVAALLTLIGYSINDTVVVFDRVRESLAHGKGTKASIDDVINSAINQTLSRTLVTSGTTILAVLLLFLFGGPGLAGFSFTLLIGILVGTYSSIFIATPIVVDFIKRKEGVKA